MRLKYLIGFCTVTLAVLVFYRAGYLGDRISYVEEDQNPLTAIQGIGVAQTPEKGAQKTSVAFDLADDVKPHDELPVLSSAGDIQEKYHIPMEQRVEFFRHLLEEYETNPTGYVKLMLAKVLESCFFAPKSESDLEKQVSASETEMLDMGVSSGDVLYNTKRLEKEYAECKQINEEIGDKHYRQLLVDAAYLDNEPRAKLYLAIGQWDTDSIEWSEGGEPEHRRKMGELIKSARSQCDPFAFVVLGAAESYGEGSLWTSPEPGGMPKAVSQYANKWAYGAYYSNKERDTRGILNQVDSDLRRLSAQLSVEQLVEAEKYGEQLFRMYCSK